MVNWMENTRKAKPWKIIAAIAMVAIVAILVTGCTQQPQTKANGADNQPGTQNQQGEPTGAQKGTTPTLNTADGRTGEEKIKEAISATIADGEYSKTVEYAFPKDEPKGTENLKVSLSIKDETITEVSIEGDSTNDITKSYVNKVNDGLQSLAVGKKITELEIPEQIAGSSLTTAAFAQAVTAIAAENYK